jgi:hypothetical protein
MSPTPCWRSSGPHFRRTTALDAHHDVAGTDRSFPHATASWSCQDPMSSRFDPDGRLLTVTGSSAIGQLMINAPSCRPRVRPGKNARWSGNTSSGD